VDLASSPVRGGVLVEGDQLTLSGAPGLGVELEPEMLARMG